MPAPFSADRLIPLLRDLAAIPGLSGDEGRIGAALAEGLRRAGGAVRRDALGNVIGQFGPPDAARRTAVLAHLDTVGFLVKQIHSDGTLGLVSVGGVNVKALPGAAVRVGDDLPGMIGVRSQHLAKSGDAAADLDSLYVQVDPAHLAEIKITAPVTFAPQPLPLGDSLYCSPYLDNRAGCAVLLELAAWLGAAALPHAVTLIGTVQEETTSAGALSALRDVAPEYAIFVDGTLSYDTPETRAGGAVVLGGGPVLTAYLYVSGLNGWHAHPGLRAHLCARAAAEGIACQQDAVRGLISDARVAGWLGIPSAIIGLPLRGKHAPLETVHLGDLVGALRLLAAALSAPYDLGR